jgi:hypothetical protein
VLALHEIIQAGIFFISALAFQLSFIQALSGERAKYFIEIFNHLSNTVKI